MRISPCCDSHVFELTTKLRKPIILTMDNNILNKYRPFCEEIAKRFNVSSDIHPNDFIFQFVFDNPTFPTKESAIEYYFNNGLDSTQKLSNILLSTCGFSGKENIRLLEFASGYGCVTRHIKNVIPFCSITACDIHNEAINFVQQKMGAEVILSTSNPENLRINQKFDVVFALSFFSHMPKTTSSRWMRQLASFIKPGGYLIFTTHGLKSRKFLSPYESLQFDSDGFYFKPASEQNDISSQEYGTACTKPQYVFNEISKIGGTTPVYYYEGYWWSHQDIFVFRIGQER
jgi:2-polyprenyl-3-methyl-5-hydroxy-6-metoxy-1,4-benzoquinol methylase